MRGCPVGEGRERGFIRVSDDGKRASEFRQETLDYQLNLNLEPMYSSSTKSGC